MSLLDALLFALFLLCSLIGGGLLMAWAIVHQSRRGTPDWWLTDEQRDLAQQRARDFIE